MEISKILSINLAWRLVRNLIDLTLAAGWIDQASAWIVRNWDQSLETFEKIWRKKSSREERRKFRSFFLEIRSGTHNHNIQLLGHIFFDLIGQQCPNYQQLSYNIG